MQTNPAANYEWWDALGLRDKSETKFLRKGPGTRVVSRGSEIALGVGHVTLQSGWGPTPVDPL